MEIVINIDKETLQDLYDSRYVSPHIKDAFRSATPLPKGHGKLIDVDRANVVARETKTDKDERIIRGFLNTLPTVVAADNAKSEDARDAEITDAHQPAWETVLYVDTEHNLIVTKAQLFEEFKAMADTGAIDDGTTFRDYLLNCTDKNGTLVRVK